MISKTLVRSALQLAGLGLVALFISTAPVQAFDFTCTDKAEECAQRCGTTVTWEVSYYYCGVWKPYPHQWECETYYVGGYNYAFGPGLETFDCDSGLQSWTCQCVI